MLCVSVNENLSEEYMCYSLSFYYISPYAFIHGTVVSSVSHLQVKPCYLIFIKIIHSLYLNERKR